MPIATFDKKYLLGLVGSGIDDGRLVEDIEKLGFGVERVGDEEISIEITSNRPDLLMAVGFARALRYFMHRSKRFRYEAKKDSGLSVAIGRRIGKVRPYASAFVAEGLELDEKALADIINGVEKFCETHGRGRRKIAVGMHDLDKIDSAGGLYYDAYDDRKYVPLNGKSDAYFSDILKSTDKGRSYAGTIDGGEFGYPALCDSRGVLALIPILNSERSRVTVSTKRMLVFVDGKSKYGVLKSADLLACLFIDIGAEVSRVSVGKGKRTSNTPTMESRQIMIPIRKIENTIGVKIGVNNATSLAEKMGYEASYIDTKVRVYVPQYRMDIINEQDVIEDIAVGYGYNYIQPMPVKSGISGQLENATVFRDRIGESMIGLGFTEAVDSYLSNEGLNFTMMRLHNDNNYVRIRNAKSDAITMLRTWLLPSLLRNIGSSQHEPMPQRMFELDMAFRIVGTGVEEAYHLAAVACDAKMNFNHIKSVVDALADMMRLDFKVEKAEHASFIEGRCARIILGNAQIGFFGEVHPAVLGAFGIEEPVSALEIDLSPFES